MIQMNKLLHTAVKRGATDIHLSVGRQPVLRVHGMLKSINTSVLTPEDTLGLMKSITPERAQQEVNETGSADFAFEFGEDQTRFRVAAFKERGHFGIVLRAIPCKFLTFKEMGLSEEIQSLLYKPRGLIVVTGPTGSGKSTTLAAMIDFINSEREVHIITVEDPIEYYHEHKRSLVTQREVGSDVPSFSEALRRALRQDPDVVLVGEMRDLETMQSAISAAETGHLVLATLHTNSAQGTISRVIDAFPSDHQQQIRAQLASTLLCVISQQLVPRCDTSGLVAAFEILITTSAIQNLIREQKDYRIDSAIQTGRDKGMQLLDDALIQLHSRGIISREEVVNRCRDHNATQEALNAVVQKRTAGIGS